MSIQTGIQTGNLLEQFFQTVFNPGGFSATQKLSDKPDPAKMSIQTGIQTGKFALQCSQPVIQTVIQTGTLPEQYCQPSIHNETLDGISFAISVPDRFLIASLLNALLQPGIFNVFQDQVQLSLQTKSDSTQVTASFPSICIHSNLECSQQLSNCIGFSTSNDSNQTNSLN